MTARQRTWAIAVGVAVVVVLAVGGFAAVKAQDLPPGTTLAGEPVGDPAAAVETAERIGQRLVSMPVVVATGEERAEVTAGALGVSFDVQGVARAAEHATGLDDWLARVSGGEATVLPVGLFFTTGDTDELAERLSSEPTDGAIEITASGLRVTDAVVGIDVTPTMISEGFRTAVAALETTPFAEWPASLQVQIEADEVQPRITQVSVDAAVERIEALTDTPITLQAQAVPEDAQTVDGVGVPLRETIDVELGEQALVQLLAVEQDPDAIERQRLRIVPSADNPPPALTAFLDRAAIGPLPRIHVEDRSPTPTKDPLPDPGSGGPADNPAYGDVSTVTGRLVSEVGEPGLDPDLDATVEAIVAAMEADQPTAEVQGEEVTEPVDPADLGIVAPVSTWTTFYEPGQARVTNIHRIAEIVDGLLVPPGGNLDINHAVGERTREGGFVEAGSILEGEFIDDVGGGVSQFGTTFFNAMWFSGIDIITNTPHSFWFDRYPAGREATIDYPGVDLELNNNTPHWILVDTAVTDDSVTVTFWSTPWFEVETTMGPREQTAEGFRMSISRIATPQEGTVDTDTFRVDYKLP